MSKLSKESVLLSRIAADLASRREAALGGDIDTDAEVEARELIEEDLNNLQMDLDPLFKFTFSEADTLLAALEQHRQSTGTAPFDLIAATALRHLAVALQCAQPVERVFRYTADVQPYVVTYEGSLDQFKTELGASLVLQDGLGWAQPLSLKNVTVTGWRLTPSDAPTSAATGFLRTATLTARVAFDIGAIMDDWDELHLDDVLKHVRLKLRHRAMPARYVALKNFAQQSQELR